MEGNASTNLNKRGNGKGTLGRSGDNLFRFNVVCHVTRSVGTTFCESTSSSSTFNTPKNKLTNFRKNKYVLPGNKGETVPVWISAQRKCILHKNVSTNYTTKPAKKGVNLTKFRLIWYQKDNTLVACGVNANPAKDVAVGDAPAVFFSSSFFASKPLSLINSWRILYVQS